MESTRPVIVNKKYDSDSISGPLTVASTGKQYYTALLIEKEDDNDGYSGQSRAHTKTFFEDTHALQFKRAEKAMNADVPMKIIGAYVHTTCPAYYVLDKDGKRQGRDLGKPISASNPPRIGHKLTFFLMQDEDFESAERQALKRLEKLGAFVDVDEDETIDTEEQKATAVTGKKTK
jgi:hypothetical protein